MTGRPAQDFEAALAAAARRLHAARVRADAARGLVGGASIVLVGAGLAAAAAIFHAGVVSWVSLGIAALIAYGRVAWSIFQARPTDWIDVAQRLDQGAGTNNAIATAYELSRDGSASAFASGAIEHGTRLARRVTADRIALPAYRWPVTRVASALAAALVAVLLAVFVSGERSSPTPAGLDPAVSRDQANAALPAATRPTSERARPVGPKPGAAAQAAAGNQPGPPSQLQPAEKATARQAGSSTPGGAAGASAGRASAAAEAGKQGSAPAPGERAMAATATQATASASAGGSDAAGASSPPLGPGGAAGGDARAAAAKSDANEPTPPGAAAVAGAAADAPGEAASSSAPPQSAGAPVRQDRGGNASRELGQSGNTGDSGNGRGGPSGTKKARGAGAIFLSVPLPDEVPSQLTAGPNRVSRQQVPPKPKDVARPPAAPSRTATASETPVSRYDVPPAASAGVDAYLARLRADPPEGTPTP